MVIRKIEPVKTVDSAIQPLKRLSKVAECRNICRQRNYGNDGKKASRISENDSKVQTEEN